MDIWQGHNLQIITNYAETCRLLVEEYGEAALNERVWREDGKFDIEDTEPSGKSKVYEDAEPEAILEKNSYQT